MKNLAILFVLIASSQIFASTSVCTNIGTDRKCVDVYTVETPPGLPIQQSDNTLQFTDPNIALRLRDIIYRSPVALTIAHFGDSHVQNGNIVSGQKSILNQLNNVNVKGFLFPFSIAKTYSHNDFKSTYSGQWISSSSMQPYPKIPLGVIGFGSKTYDDEFEFTIQFNSLSNSIERGSKLRIFYDAEVSDYHLIIKCGDSIANGTLDAANNVKSVRDFVCNDNTYSFKLKRIGNEGSFTLTGLQFQSNTKSIGINNLGVGGAAYGAILAQKKFETQIKILDPDLVILDYGTNDIIYKNNVPELIDRTIIDTIKKIRNSANDPLIILTNVQEMRFKGRTITAAAKMNQIIKKIAFENNCFYFDWFSISGGAKSLNAWEQLGYASKDGVHLTSKGYLLKGRLLANAILNAANYGKSFPGYPLILAHDEDVETNAHTYNLHNINPRIIYKDWSVSSTGKSSTGKSSTGKSSTGKSSTGKSSTGKSSTGKSSTGKSSTGP